LSKDIHDFVATIVGAVAAASIEAKKKAKDKLSLPIEYQKQTSARREDRREHPNNTGEECRVEKIKAKTMILKNIDEASCGENQKSQRIGQKMTRKRGKNPHRSIDEECNSRRKMTVMERQERILVNLFYLAS